MIPKQYVTRIRPLKDKKGRVEREAFLVEGEKSVAELLASKFEVEMLIATPGFLKTREKVIEHRGESLTVVPATQEDIEFLGTLESNRSAIAVAKQKKNSDIPSPKAGEIIIALSAIRDPGNVGTIVRIADWYGISHIVASEDTAELFNPKTIAASMGSFTRVSVTYTNLSTWLPTLKVPIIGATLSGDNAHTLSFPKEGVLLMGSESHGISPHLEALLTHKISIPKFGEAESLNVAVATAVLVDSWKRSI